MLRLLSMSKPSTPSSQRRKLHRSSGIFGLIPPSPKIHYPIDANNLPLDSAMNTESFAQLSDAVEELEDNMTSLHQIHNSIANGFNESFASFLYGLLMTMWCVDFPGLPTKSDFDKISYSAQLDLQISDIHREIALLQQQNQSLKQQLQHNSKIASRHVLKPKPVVNRAPTKTASKISKPAIKPANQSQASSSIAKTTPTRSSTSGPNLNQPPRYLQGLFNNPKTPTTNRRVHKPPTSIKNRPPFR